VAGSSDLPELLAFLDKAALWFEAGKQADSQVARIFDALRAVAVSRDRRIQELLERTRLEHEMTVARDVLHHFLPQACWHVGELTLGGWLRPADWVGGDCFDYFPLASGAGFLLADACGHGLGATLLAAETRALVRSLICDHALDITAERSGRMLYHDTAPNRFVTACFGRVTTTGRVDYVCAGQAPLLHYEHESGRCRELGATGPPLGVIKEATYRTDSLQLRPGDRLVLATDGVYDWGRHVGPPYGQTRLEELLTQEGRLACSDLLSTLEADLLRHSSSHTDDATVLVICRC